MISVVVLDTGPLGLVTKRRGIPEAEICRDWVRRCARQKISILVPALAYYGVGRELERLNNIDGIKRLEALATFLFSFEQTYGRTSIHEAPR